MLRSLLLAGTAAAISTFHSDQFCGCDTCCNVITIDRETTFVQQYVGPYDDTYYYDSILAENVTHHRNMRFHAYQTITCTESEGFVFTQDGSELYRANLTQLDTQSCEFNVDGQLTVEQLRQPLVYYYGLKNMAGSISDPVSVDLDIVPHEAIASISGVGGVIFRLDTVSINDYNVSIDLSRYSGFEYCTFPSTLTLELEVCSTNYTATGDSSYEFYIPEILDCSTYYNGRQYLELRIVGNLYGSTNCSTPLDGNIFHNPFTHKLRTSSTLVGTVVENVASRVSLAVSETVGLKSCKTLVPSGKAIFTVISTMEDTSLVTNTAITEAKIGVIPLVEQSFSCTIDGTSRICTHILRTQSCLDMTVFTDGSCKFITFGALQVANTVTYTDQGAVVARLNGIHRHVDARTVYEDETCPSSTTAVDVSQSKNVAAAIRGGSSQPADEPIILTIGVTDETRSVISVIIDTVIIVLNTDRMFINVQDKIDNFLESSSPYFNDVTFCSYFDDQALTCEPMFNRSSSTRWNSWATSQIGTVFDTDGHAEDCVDNIPDQYSDAFVFTPTKWISGISGTQTVSVKVYARLRACTERYGRHLQEGDEYVQTEFTLQLQESVSTEGSMSGQNIGARGAEIALVSSIGFMAFAIIVVVLYAGYVRNTRRIAREKDQKRLASKTINVTPIRAPFNLAQSVYGRKMYTT